MVFILSLMLPFIHSRATVSGRLWPFWSPPVTVCTARYREKDLKLVACLATCTLY
eukprot:SAG31_NODE_12505_length_936_cov_1.904421_1_plen_55_part_10